MSCNAEATKHLIFVKKWKKINENYMFIWYSALHLSWDASKVCVCVYLNKTMFCIQFEFRLISIEHLIKTIDLLFCILVPSSFARIHKDMIVLYFSVFRWIPMIISSNTSFSPSTMRCKIRFCLILKRSRTVNTLVFSSHSPNVWKMHWNCLNTCSCEQLSCALHTSIQLNYKYLYKSNKNFSYQESAKYAK